VSGPVSAQDTGTGTAELEAASGPTLEILPSRTAEVGGAQVRRALPRRNHRTVGAWCFADHFGPAPGLGIGPHPHMGLQTVTWLLAGEVVHTDSLGSEQLIRPGQLNLMTAGHGVAHAELSHPGRVMHGVQLWVALPDATRDGAPAFEHHATLPSLELGTVQATVMVGSVAGAGSPARADTPLVGVDLDHAGGSAEIPLQAGFEHALIVFDGALEVDGEVIAPGVLAYLGSNRDSVELRASAPARALLIGGEPFGVAPLMWWNFVARTREEMDAAYRDWEAHSPRFGEVRSPLPRIPAPPPVWS
jgi:quercetin 2,3-dioxygenase